MSDSDSDKSSKKKRISDKMEDEGEESDSDKEEEEDKRDPQNVLKILISSDNHLGFKSNHPEQKDDSFITMEEILKIAKEKKVDFVLLGGDLFHKNKPTPTTLHRTMELFRKYCCGPDPISLRIHSNQRTNFARNGGTVNYEDPNYNISLPIFAIHGNHDDPTGEKQISPLDMLSVNNLINYFGKNENVDKVELKPILISKGGTKLSLYGLGHIRDERLYRIFEKKKVTFYRPKKLQDEWFNIFVIHQNRHQHHTRKGSINEMMFGGFLDLVVWGHEHEQNISPTPSAKTDMQIMQPGSTVVCSLCPEEEKEKKIAILELHKGEYKCTDILLRTVRPFIMERIILSEEKALEDVDKEDDEKVLKFLVKKVESMIKEALNRCVLTEEIIEKHPTLKKPLVRLKVDNTAGYITPNPQRFGQRFVGRVANPDELILFHRKKSYGSRKRRPTDVSDDLQAPTEGQGIEDFISNRLKSSNAELEILDEFKFSEATNDYVIKEELGAIGEFIDKDIRRTQKKIWRESKNLQKRNKMIDDAVISDLLKNDMEKKRAEKGDEKKKDDDVIMEDEKKGDEKKGEESDDKMDESDDIFDFPSSPARDDDSDFDDAGGKKKKKKKKKSTRGRKKKETTTTKKKTTRGRKKKTPKKKKKTAKKKKKKRKFKPLSDDEGNMSLMTVRNPNDDDDDEDGWKPEPEIDDTYNPEKDDDSEDVQIVEKKKKEIVIDDNDDDDDDDDDVVMVRKESVKKERPKRKAAKKSEKKRKRNVIEIDDDDDDDDVEIKKPKKKKRKLNDGKKKKKRKKKMSFKGLTSSSESEEDESINDSQLSAQWSKKKRKK